MNRVCDWSVPYHIQSGPSASCLVDRTSSNASSSQIFRTNWVLPWAQHGKQNDGEEEESERKHDFVNLMAITGVSTEFQRWNGRNPLLRTIIVGRINTDPKKSSFKVIWLGSARWSAPNRWLENVAKIRGCGFTGVEFEQKVILNQVSIIFVHQQGHGSSVLLSGGKCKSWTAELLLLCLRRKVPLIEMSRPFAFVSLLTDKSIYCFQFAPANKRLSLLSLSGSGLGTVIFTLIGSNPLLTHSVTINSPSIRGITSHASGECQLRWP